MNEDTEQLEQILEQLRPIAIKLGIADLRLIEVKGTIYYFPTLPAKDE